MLQDKREIHRPSVEGHCRTRVKIRSKTMTLKRLFTDFILAAVAILSLSLYLMLPASPAASQRDGGGTLPTLIYLPNIFNNHFTEELAFISERQH